MSGCVVNGRRCTQCCRTISLYFTKKLFSYEELADTPKIGSDRWFALRYWRPLSPDVVAYENPFLFDGVSPCDPYTDVQWFRCVWITDNGCGCYESRPDVCRNYPAYNATQKEKAALLSLHPKGEYVDGCVEFTKLGFSV